MVASNAILFVLADTRATLCCLVFALTTKVGFHSCHGFWTVKEVFLPVSFGRVQITSPDFHWCCLRNQHHLCVWMWETGHAWRTRSFSPNQWKTSCLIGIKVCLLLTQVIWGFLPGNYVFTKFSWNECITDTFFMPSVILAEFLWSKLFYSHFNKPACIP